MWTYINLCAVPGILSHFCLEVLTLFLVFRQSFFPSHIFTSLMQNELYWESPCKWLCDRWNWFVPQGEALRQSLLAQYYEKVPLRGRDGGGGRGGGDGGSRNVTLGRERKSLIEVQVTVASRSLIFDIEINRNCQ